MSKLPDLPVYDFDVFVMDVGGVAALDDDQSSVTASYFQESGVYTVFKDTDHSVVKAYKTDLVVLIERSEQPVDRR